MPAQIPLSFDPLVVQDTISTTADPWAAWAARPHTPQNRLADLVLQIRRDQAVLRESRCYHEDNEFFTERIRLAQAEAQGLLP